MSMNPFVHLSGRRCRSFQLPKPAAMSTVVIWMLMLVILQLSSCTQAAPTSSPGQPAPGLPLGLLSKMPPVFLEYVKKFGLNYENVLNCAVKEKIITTENKEKLVTLIKKTKAFENINAKTDDQIRTVLKTLETDAEAKKHFNDLFQAAMQFLLCLNDKGSQKS